MQFSFLKHTLLSVFLAVAAFSGCRDTRAGVHSTGNAAQPKNKTMDITIAIGSHVAKATLYDTAASRDFAALLPLTLSLRDYNNTEKIADLPGKLSTEGAPEGFTPSACDLTYYVPWGNLALFYKGFRYSPGLVSLGKVTSGMEYLTADDGADVTFELEK
jgi:hypothetical protein